MVLNHTPKKTNGGSGFAGTAAADLLKGEMGD
jgi:hypothetical protein